MARQGTVCQVSDAYGSGVLSDTSHGYCFSPTKKYPPDCFLRMMIQT